MKKVVYVIPHLTTAFRVFYKTFYVFPPKFQYVSGNRSMFIWKCNTDKHRHRAKNFRKLSLNEIWEVRTFVSHWCNGISNVLLILVRIWRSILKQLQHSSCRYISVASQFLIIPGVNDADESCLTIFNFLF